VSFTRRIESLAALFAVGLATAACTPPFPPEGVTLRKGVPAVVWKFCDPDRAVGGVVVSRVTEDEPETWPQVWSARLDPGSAPLTQIPIADRVVGYTVETHDGWPLQPDVTYAVTEVADTEDFNAGGCILEFHPSELSEGDVVSHEEGGQDLGTWLGPDGPDCH
jgi:hypothetical protein